MVAPPSQVVAPSPTLDSNQQFSPNFMNSGMPMGMNLFPMQFMQQTMQNLSPDQSWHPNNLQMAMMQQYMQYMTSMMSNPMFLQMQMFNQQNQQYSDMMKVEIFLFNF
jgi:hypothetical protein